MYRYVGSKYLRILGNVVEEVPKETKYKRPARRVEVIRAYYKAVDIEFRLEIYVFDSERV